MKSKEKIQAITQQSSIINLSLLNIRAIAKKLALLQPDYPVIIIGGTNGKGSTVHALRHIYQLNHYRVGTFTSPYMHTPTELIRLNNIPISEEILLSLLKKIDQARGDTPLTEYEFLFLATLLFFKQAQPDIIILEVCMGGRDDVVNIIDPDCAIITNVALDHCQWLGNTRDEIGAIKAGIFRENIPIILGEENPPQCVLDAAYQQTTKVYQLGSAFDKPNINTPLYSENIAVALQATKVMSHRLPLNIAAIDTLNSLTTLPGRCQQLDTPCPQIRDATHNPASAERLAEFLSQYNDKQPIHAVFSMYQDKAIKDTVRPLLDKITCWHIAPLQHPRGATLTTLQAALPTQQTKTYQTITKAYQAAITLQPRLLVVFGSFQVLAEIDNIGPSE